MSAASSSPTALTPTTPSLKDRVAGLLLGKGWVDADEMWRMGLRSHRDTILALRRQGWQITSESSAETTRYRLVAAPDGTPGPGATLPLWAEGS